VICKNETKKLDTLVAAAL